MSNDVLKSIKLNLIIAVLSGSLLAFQLFIISLLTITQWYHFAYMVISIALLGFGLAGTILSIFKNVLLSKYETFLNLLVLSTALLITFSVNLSQTDFFYFDSFIIFSDPVHITKLIGFYLLFTMPFFCGALAIGLTFTKKTENISTLYFSNMTGSGAGALIYMLVNAHVKPEIIPSMISLTLIIFLIFRVYHYRAKQLSAWITSIVISACLVLLFYPTFKYSEFKSISKVLDLPDSEKIISEYSNYGEISFVKSPHLRYAPGLSLTFNKELNNVNSAFVNGNWKGPLIAADSQYESIFKNSAEFLPYLFSDRKKVLFLESATGEGIKNALIEKSESITAVEHNATLTDLIRGPYSYLVDSVYSHNSVELLNVSGRTYLLSSNNRFDLIKLPIIDSFGGNSGLTAINTDFLLTKEAFADMISMLNFGGVLSVSTWIDYPYNNALKLFATIAQVLDEHSIADTDEHIVAVRNWNLITVLVKKEEFTNEELDSIRYFCRKLNFDPIILKGIKEKERNYFNRLNDPHFFDLIDSLLYSERSRETLYSVYPFNIRPATDSKPYFFQFMKMSAIPELQVMFGNSQIPFFEIGYFLLYLTFLQIMFITLLLIIVPLFIWRYSSKIRDDYLAIRRIDKIKTMIYFSGIGLGYIFLEIIFIQYFSLYFGNIIYSTSLVLALMLFCSGMGSLYSKRIKFPEIDILKVFFLILVLIVIYLVSLNYIIKVSISFPFLIKIFFSILLISPISFLMGMPFPVGLKLVHQNNDLLIPWAWGINGLFSVIGAVLAVIISVELSINSLIIFSFFSYFAALLIKFNKNYASPLS